MNFFELVQIFSGNIWLYLGAFVLVLSILVFVHEWGHYIVARLCGVRVEVFSIGFGKEIAGFVDKAGTRWKVCLIPLGGYVKLFGDVDPASVKHSDKIEDSETGAVRPLTAAERETAFFAKPVWKRAAVVAAGPAINYVFAIILLSLLFTFNGQPITPPVAAAIVGGSSADKNGFKPHDVVLSIDDRAIEDFEDIRMEMMISLDEQRHFKVRRDGKIIDIYASPQKIELSDRFGFKHSRGLLGLISPRHAIGIKNITKIAGVEYSDIESVRAALKRHLGSEFKIEMKSGVVTDVFTVNPRPEHNASLGMLDDPDSDLLYLVAKEPEVFVKYPVHIAFLKSIQQAWNITNGTLKALGQMVMGTRSPTELGGVIRIGALAGDMAKQGVIAFILFTALLSINLGLVNLLPIPILDGGHLVFYAFEALMGRPLSERIQEYAFYAGFFFLISIMVYANLSDIMQLIL